MGVRTVGEVGINVVVNSAKAVTGFEATRKASRDAAKQMKADMLEARGGIMVLGEEIGVHLPRHVQAFVAKLPGVAAAMSAAFAPLAVIAIGVAMVEAGKKVFEYGEKIKEAGQKHAETWRGIAEPMRMTNDQMQLANDKLGNAIAKLEGKPQNRLKEAIDEAIISADELGEKLSGDIKKITDALKTEEEGTFSRLWTGNADSSDITKHARTLQTALGGIDVADAGLDRSGMNAEQIKTHRQALTAQYRTALSADLDWTRKEIAKLYYWNDSAKKVVRPGQQSRVDQLTDYQTSLSQMDRYTELSQQSGELKGRRDIDQGRAEAQKKAKEEAKRRAEMNSRNGEAMGALGGKRAKEQIDEEIASLELLSHVQKDVIQGVKQWGKARQEAQVAGFRGDREGATEGYRSASETSAYNVGTGAISPRQRLAELSNALDQEHQLQTASFNEELALYSRGTKEYQDVLNERKKADAEYFKQRMDLQRKASEQGVTGAFNDLVRRSQDYNAQFKDLLESTINTVNDSLLKMMTSQYHKGDWKDAGKQIFTDVAKTGLQDAEGSIMKAFKLGGKADGSKGSPLHVVVDGGLAVGGAGGGTMASLLGYSSSNSGDDSAASSGVRGFFSKLLGARAGGGLMSPGGFYLTGEHGPELTQVGSTSRISNARDTAKILGGGGTHYHDNRTINVNAQGATDPAAVHAAVNRAIAKAAPSIAAMAINAQADMRRRRPSSMG